MISFVTPKLFLKYNRTWDDSWRQQVR